MSALLVCYGQVGDKLLAQKADFTLRYHNIVAGQIFYYLLFIVTMHKKGTADVNQNIVSKSGTVRGKRTQLPALIYRAVKALQNSFSGTKCPDIHGYDTLFSGFEHSQITADLGIKTNCRPVFKQVGRTNVSG
jgi:hypothetical protein